jgi:very-short-patch-repair endonuclease
MSSKLKATAKEQRDNPTYAESKLWELLRRGQLDGHKFRRKHVFRNFIVDFACLERHLVIEVETDEKNRDSDDGKKKDQWLKSRDYIVLYFKEAEVNRGPGDMVPTIKRGLKGLPPVERDTAPEAKVTKESKPAKKESEKTKALPKTSMPKVQKVEKAVTEKNASSKKTEQASEPKKKPKQEEKVVKNKTDSKVKSAPSVKEPVAPKTVIARKEEPKSPTEPVKKAENLKESSPELVKNAEETKIDQTTITPKTKVELEPIKKQNPLPITAEAKPQSSGLTEVDKLLEKLQAGDSLSGLKVGDIDFSKMEFKDCANLSGVIFSGVTNFSEAVFLKGADFSDAQFTNSSGLNFSNVSFLGDSKVNFVDTFFNKESLVDFSFMKVETPQSIRFENVFLGRASFFNTDVSHFQLKNIQFCQLPIKDEDWFDFFSFLKRNIIGVKTWSEFKIQVKNFLPIALSPGPVKRLGLIDEVWNEVANNGQTRLMDSKYYQQVSELYRQFRKNFQRNKVYSLTVDMRYGEYKASQK